MILTKDPFGTTADGKAVDVFTISNENNYEIRCMTYGATLISVKAPDNAGTVRQITIGYDRLEEYLAGHPFFGSSVGRVCNRIRGAKFVLGGKTCELPANEGPNMLHGGKGGFHTRVWEAQEFQSADRAGVVFSRVSPDGEEGFPGTLEVSISISLTARNAIEFEYRAQTDKATPVNLTNHAYWNLSGAPDLYLSEEEVRDIRKQPGGALGRHQFTINAAERLEVDEGLIPTGRILPVGGTAYDFQEARTMAEMMPGTDGGYDLCYVLNRPAAGESAAEADESAAAADGGDVQTRAGEVRAAKPRFAAEVLDPDSGRRVRVSTSLPAVQFYSGKNLRSQRSRTGIVLERSDAFCLETQIHSDAVNNPSFPSMILEPGEVFEHRSVYEFSS